ETGVRPDVRQERVRGADQGSRSAAAAAHPRFHQLGRALRPGPARPALARARRSRTGTAAGDGRRGAGPGADMRDMRRTTVTHRISSLVVLAVASTVALVVASSPAGAQQLVDAGKENG